MDFVCVQVHDETELRQSVVCRNQYPLIFRPRVEHQLPQRLGLNKFRCQPLASHALLQREEMNHLHSQRQVWNRCFQEVGSGVEFGVCNELVDELRGQILFLLGGNLWHIFFPITGQTGAAGCESLTYIENNGLSEIPDSLLRKLVEQGHIEGNTRPLVQLIRFLLQPLVGQKAF